ncbi:MAG: hypothetical protein ACI8UP_002779 [Porticoccaceae bacterium]|jgi:hypothetical protein
MKFLSKVYRQQHRQCVEIKQCDHQRYDYIVANALMLYQGDLVGCCCLGIWLLSTRPRHFTLLVIFLVPQSVNDCFEQHTVITSIRFRMDHMRAYCLYLNLD